MAQRRPRSAALRPAAAFAAALTIVLALVPATAAADKILGLSNAKFEFNVGAGQSGSGETTVYNDGSDPMKVMVYAANQIIDKSGKTTFVVPSRDDRSPADSPASWLRISLPASTKAVGNTPYLELKPGESVPVKFEFEVPQGVAPGDHQVLIFFEIFEFPGQEQGATSDISGRLGARIRLRVKGRVAQVLKVRPVVVREFVIGDKIPYSFFIRNEGNVDIPLSGTLTVFDSNDGEVIASNVVTQTTVYARSIAEHAGTLDAARLGLGRYRAELAVSYKKETGSGAVDDQIVVERTVWVIPLWLAITAVVVVGGLVLWVSWRGAVRSGERRAASRMEQGETAADVVRTGRRPRWFPWYEQRRKP